MLEVQIQLKCARRAVPKPSPHPGRAPEAPGAWTCVGMATGSAGLQGCARMGVQALLMAMSKLVPQSGVAQDGWCQSVWRDRM